MYIHLLKSFYMTHRVPGVLKRSHLPWASQGSYIATLKLHMLSLTSSVSSVWYIAVDTLLLLLFIAPSKNNSLYPDFLNSYIKLHTLFFAHLSFRTKNKQIYWFLFLPGFAGQKLFFNIHTSLGHTCTIQSCIHFILLNLSSRNKKRSIH